MMGLALKLRFQVKNQRSGQIRWNAEGFCDVTQAADFLTQKGRKVTDSGRFRTKSWVQFVNHTCKV